MPAAEAQCVRKPFREPPGAARPLAARHRAPSTAHVHCAHARTSSRPGKQQCLQAQRRKHSAYITSPFPTHRLGCGCRPPAGRRTLLQQEGGPAAARAQRHGLRLRRPGAHWPDVRTRLGGRPRSAGSARGSSCLQQMHDGGKTLQSAQAAAAAQSHHFASTVLQRQHTKPALTRLAPAANQQHNRIMPTCRPAAIAALATGLCCADVLVPLLVGAVACESSTCPHPLHRQAPAAGSPWKGHHRMRDNASNHRHQPPTGLVGQPSVLPVLLAVTCAALRARHEGRADDEVCAHVPRPLVHIHAGESHCRHSSDRWQ
jgi:hypothetical protein